MKKIIFLIFSIFLTIQKVYAFDIEAKQAILIDYESGQVLYKKNENERVYPSSMTKIMTAYLIFEKLQNKELNLNDRFQVSYDAWKQEGSRMFLDIGSKVTLDELLRGLIVQSGNDAAYVLAENSEGSIENFVKQMNKKSEELSLSNTHFTNPIGFSEDQHYMSVMDTALLSRELIRKFPNYYIKYFSIKEYKYNGILQQNRNKLLFLYNWVDGIKTGHTEAGGYSLAASGFMNNRRLIAVVNGCATEEDRIANAKKLLNYGFLTVKRHTLYEKTQIVDNQKVYYGKKGNVNIITKDNIFIFAENIDDIKKTKIVYDKKLNAPLYKNEKIGNFIIKTKYDTLVYKLYIGEDIKEVNIIKKIFFKVWYFIINIFKR